MYRCVSYTISGEGPLNILALDGGGVRGLSSLLILRRIMTQLHLQLDPEDEDDTPIRPCDHFHLICGTGTGGLIALMLGRLRMTIDECIDGYLKLSKEIFDQRTSFTTFGRLGGNAQYAASKMEETMKDMIRTQTGDEDAKMKDPLKRECCKTFVVAIARDSADGPPFKLRTYSTREFPADSCTIWQAARATSAATRFFDPVTFGVPGITYIVSHRFTFF
jgi:patatin-like phospholipase/acyl hydrolase